MANLRLCLRKAARRALSASLCRWTRRCLCLLEERSSPEINLVLLSRRARSAGRLFLVLIMWFCTQQRAKTSRGAGCVPSSTRPPAVERGRLSTEGGRGEVGRTKLFTMTLCGRYPNVALVCSRALLRGAGFWQREFRGLLESLSFQISFF